MTRSTKQIIKRKTAGELNQEATRYSERIDPLEIAEQRCNDVMDNLLECAHKHENIFDEEEFFVCLFVALDPLIKTVRRHNYAAFIHMPSPRPNQSCFLYNKKLHTLKRLWSLPAPHVMAVISEMEHVAPQWKSTKKWCDSFYRRTFWEDIRAEHQIAHLSEHEYLLAHRDELVKAGCNEVERPPTDPFDFSKVVANKVDKQTESALQE